MSRFFLVLLFHLFAPFYVQADIAVPGGFKLQKLEVTDGSIAMPVDWHYREEATRSGILWTISKEDLNDGPYSIGQRIQLLVGVEKASKRPREDFVDKLISNKRRISNL